MHILKRARTIVYRSVSFVSILAVIIISAIRPAISLADPLPVFMTLQIIPRTIFTSIPSNVRFIIGISGTSISNVELYRVEADETRTFVANLYDDATHGDTRAGDRAYTNVLTLTQTQAGTLRYDVSATVNAVTGRSDISSLTVTSTPNLEAIWRQFVDRMIKGDVEGALLYFSEDQRASYRTSYQIVGESELVAAFSTARNLTRVKLVPGEAEYSVILTISGADRTGTLLFQQDLWGVWHISGLGFDY